MDLPPILIVDDSQRDTELALAALNAYSLFNEVISLSDGAGALDYLYQRGEFAGRPARLPAIILLDLEMPRVGGLEVLRQIKSDPALHRIPVIIMTASCHEPDLVTSVSLGAGAYVLKPVDFPKLMEAAKQVGGYWWLIHPPAQTDSSRLDRWNNVQAQLTTAAVKPASVRPIHILHLEDSARDAEMIQDLVEAETGYEITHAADRSQFTERLAQEKFDLIISDFNLPDFDGLSALRLAKSKQPDTPVIIVSGAIDAAEAAECLKAGASDYLLKQRLDRLPSAIARSLEEARRERLRKEVESRLRDTDAQLRAVMENLGDGLLLTDLEDTILDVNPCLIAMTGFSRAEFIGHKGCELLSDPKQFQELTSHKADGANGITNRYEMRLRRKDGTGFPAEITSAPLRDRQGVLFGDVEVIRDITDRKLAEQTVRELNTTLEQRVQERTASLQVSERRFRALAVTAGRLIWTTNAEGIIVEAIPDWEGFVGQNPGESLQNDWGRFIHPEDLPRMHAEFFQGIAKQANFAFEFRARRHDGVYRHLRSLAAPVLGADGRVQEWIGSLEDVTDQRESDRALRQVHNELGQANARLRQASQMKSEFLANMSHELRTPLNAVLGLTEVLLDQQVGALNPRQIKSLNTISSSGTHLLSLINDILDLSKVEAGKLELYPENLNVDEICQACLTMINAQAHQKRISVAFDNAATVKTLPADPKRFKQILVNLLSNAVKFTPEGGAIGLTIRSPIDQGVATFTVWDTGIGIAPEDLPRLFQAFSQIDSGLARAQEGSGLGLALVSKLVELHGGSLGLETEPGKGSRFSFSLSLVSSMEAAKNRSLSESMLSEPAEGRPTQLDVPATPLNLGVLLVEDNEANIQVIGGYLEDRGCQMQYARNGAEALTVLQQTRPDIIMMDLQLPVMDGLTAIGKIRSELGLRDIPIIALTALAMSGDRERALAAGATDYVSKPVRLRALAALIQRLSPKTCASLPFP